MRVPFLAGFRSAEILASAGQNVPANYAGGSESAVSYGIEIIPWKQRQNGFDVSVASFRGVLSRKEIGGESYAETLSFRGWSMFVGWTGRIDTVSLPWR